MHRLVSIFLIAATTAAFSQDSPSATKEVREAALAAIKKWRSFEGTWEGEVRYVAAPKEDWYKERIPFRVTFKNNQPKVFSRQGVREWSELGATYRLHQPDELTVVIHAYGAGGVWTENTIVVLTRRTEDNAEVYIQRVVNNWAGKPLPGEDVVYGDTRAGKVTRQ
jgi:hypothetical protein